MDDTSPKPAFLTTREVADLLRVKERKVYDLAAAGEIPCRRLTGKLLFPREEIDAWLAGAAPATGANAVAGSHDPLLDWAIRESGAGLATIFDGSLDGLARIGAGEAVAAGMHVFEPERDDWNLGRIAAALPGAPVVVIEWAKRRQGLLLAREGPRSIADLKGLRVARRQPGSGSAILFEHMLAAAGIDPASVDFIPERARTETEAAAAVASGAADAAPGLEAMARQFRLAFAPLMEERFDLVINRRAYFEPPVQRLLAFARTAAFETKAAEMGGYDLAAHGRVVWNAA